MSIVYNKGNINAYLIGLMLSCNILAPLMSFVPNGITIIVFIPFILLSILNYRRSFSKETIVWVVTISLYFVLFSIYSLLKDNFASPTVKNCLEFIVLGCPFIIASQLSFDSLKAITTIAYASLIALPFQYLQVNSLDVTYAEEGQLLMSVSYIMARIAIVGMIFFVLNKKIINRTIAVIEFLVATAFLVTVGSRGASVALAIAVCMIISYLNNRQIRVISPQVATFTVLTILTFVFFEDIIYWVDDVLYRHNMTSIGITRIIESFNSGDELSTGRTDLYKVAFNDFLSSPLVGKGIASFSNFEGVYPHNIIIQQLQEGGVIFGLPLVVATISSFFVLNGDVCKSDRFLLIFLISSALPHLMLSTYFWNYSIYWFLFGLTIRARFGFKPLDLHGTVVSNVKRPEC